MAKSDGRDWAASEITSS